MNTALMYDITGLVCRFKAAGGGFRNLKFDLFYKYMYIHKACKFKNLKLLTAWDFAKINTLNLVPLAKETWFPKEQSL